MLRLINVFYIWSSGGYIFKYDNDNNDEGDTLFNTRLSQLQMIMVYPKKDDATPESVKALSGYVTKFNVVFLITILSFLDLLL